MSNTTKNQDAYQMLRELILDGTFTPNERLVEADLAERLSANRANIRAAIAVLERDGLVVYEPFRGAKVRLIKPDEAIEIFEVRAALELVVIRQAVDRICDADRTILAELLDAFRGLVAQGDSDAAGLASRRIRQEIWRISQHKTAGNVLRTLNSQLVRFWFHLSHTPGRTQVMLQDMEAIVAALLRGSTADAVHAVTAYHAHSLSALRALLRTRNGIHDA